MPELNGKKIPYPKIPTSGYGLKTADAVRKDAAGKGKSTDNPHKKGKIKEGY